MRFFNDEDFVKGFLAMNPHLTPEQIDLLYDAGANNKKYLARNARLTDEQFMRLFNDGGLHNSYLAQNPNLTPEQIDLLYYTKGVDKKNLALKPRLTDEQFLRAFNDGSVLIKYHLAQNPSINPLANQQFASGIFNWRW